MPAPHRLAVLGAFLLLATAASAQDIVDVVADHWLTFVDQGDTLRLPYYASHDLAVAQPGLVRVVIVVHGTLRNADSYFEVMQDAAGLAGAAGDSTLIIAPQFLTDADVEHFELGPQVLCWLYDGWRQGDQSVSGSHGGLSSFAVADSLLLLATQVCPDLREAVVTGHSAGAQFANRHAASSPMPDRLREEFGVHYRSVVANPSTYVYFTPERWVRGTAYEFATPYRRQIADCPGWDDYKYGLQNPNPYFTLPADTRPGPLRAPARRAPARAGGRQPLRCLPRPHLPRDDAGRPPSRARRRLLELPAADLRRTARRRSRRSRWCPGPATTTTRCSRPPAASTTSSTSASATNPCSSPASSSRRSPTSRPMAARPSPGPTTTATAVTTCSSPAPPATATCCATSATAFADGTPRDPARRRRCHLPRLGRLRRRRPARPGPGLLERSRPAAAQPRRRRFRRRHARRIADPVARHHRLTGPTTTATATSTSSSGAPTTPATCCCATTAP